MKKLSWLIQAGFAFACAATCFANPKIGVFPESNDASGKTKADQWEAWVGRDIDYILQFYAGDTWDYIDGTSSAGLNWWSNQWVNYPQEYKDKLVIAIPILPTKDVLPSPSGDNLPDDGSSLQAGSTGAYDQRWVNCATKLVARGMGNATLRLGWEFNGGWYTWNTKNGRIAYFKNYWIHIVNAMRSVPGANFKFCWNPTVGDEGIGDPTVGFPGAAYVDTIGLDIYDTYSGYGTTGYPDNLPESWQRDSIRNNAWLSKKEWGNYHLDWWTAKSNTYGVPLSFPEWGLDNPTAASGAGHGGQDNPIFLNKFYAYVNSPSRNVAWHAYFDQGSGTSPRKSALFFSDQYPVCKALFPTLFGLKYQDTFEDSIITDWSYSPAGQWSVVTDSGDKAFRFDYNWTTTSGTASAGNNAWTNYKLLVDAKITETNAWSDLYVYARYLDGNNYYRLRMEEQSAGAKRWYLDKKVAGTLTTLGAWASANFALNTWYTIGLEVNGSTITVYQNGAQIMQRTDTSLTAGRIAIGGTKQDINFDNVEVQ